MKPVELKSTLIAGVLGAVIVVIFGFIASAVTGKKAKAEVVTGFLVGVGVQIGVRLLGVS